MIDEMEKVEIVAAECHKQWSGWTEHLLSKHNELPSGNLVLGAEWKHRWMKQVNTPYAELSGDEKDSDRREARKILAALAALPLASPKEPKCKLCMGDGWFRDNDVIVVCPICLPAKTEVKPALDETGGRI